MAEIKINKFEDLIKAHIGNDKKLVGMEIEKLPPAGVGSIMLKVNATIRPKNANQDENQNENIHAVAKILPSSQLTRQLFDVQTTYKVEIAFYDVILPVLNKFRRENGVESLECFPQFYGARININGSDIVDDDCAIVMENLVYSGYTNGNRLVGFDEETAKIVLKDLADFHATTIALRIQKPDIYNKKIIPLCEDLKSKNKSEDDTFTKPMCDLLKLIIEENETTKHLKQLIPTDFFVTKGEGTGNFAGIAHSDLWVNNTMQKHVDGKVRDNKLIDWQCYANKSCLTDLIFFLFTSVKLAELKENLDNFLKYYHENLVKTLQDLHCNIENFTYENFLEDIRHEQGVNMEYKHVLMFILIVKREGKLSEEIFEEWQKAEMEKPEDTVKKLSSYLKGTICLFLLEGEKRGWFNNYLKK